MEWCSRSVTQQRGLGRRGRPLGRWRSAGQAAGRLLRLVPDGQVVEPYSISAGLDYPGIGPIHAHLFDTGRVKFVSATDDEAMNAGIELSRLEGIIPAIESAHAIAVLSQFEFDPDDVVVVNLSGRGDKDLETYIRWGKY